MTPRPPFAAFAPPIRPPSPLRSAITAACRREEAACVRPLLEAATLDVETRAAIRETARQLVERLRTNGTGSGLEGLMQEYSLSSQEGVALMCLAEALLRIPDTATRDALIRDKIAGGDWTAHLGDGRSLFVNAATWGLVVTGRIVGSVDDRGLGATLARLVGRVGEPLIRRGIDIAMRMMGEQFVIGETIEQALQRARKMEAKGYRYSYDMLGEAARSAADAERYLAAYEHAIHAIGRASTGSGRDESPGISIKLSALHPRYSRAQSARVMAELLPRLQGLALLARDYDIGLNIDAEETDRLELSLDLFESLALDADLAGWNGLGFVVQSYGKRCPFVIDWLIELARRAGRRIMVRLVKGAYWDSEIKRAQTDGLSDFPVYTRKLHSDIAYIACAKTLLAAPDAIFPQFATHNAQTLASIYHLAGPVFEPGQYEFQCLHGMGEPLYREVVGPGKLDRPCRIYAPVGTHETLLPYLIRRLLENGANSSFVNRVADPAVPIADLIADPAAQVAAMPEPGHRHERISLPADIYPGRRNSEGIDLDDEAALAALTTALHKSAATAWKAMPSDGIGTQRPVLNPADSRDIVGIVAEVSVPQAAAAVARAAGSRWSEVSVVERAAMLDRAADAMQADMPVLLGLIVREAGKTVSDAIGEVREAIDFLRYYAMQARLTFGVEQKPLGPIVCISPWNFLLAIFTGQIAAALVAGNPVLAKPAEETPLVASEAIRLLHEAGIPADALQFLPGDGAIGAALVAAPQTAGVMFTGSTDVARLIQRQLATRLSPSGMPVPLIAETGGQNAMIVDSSALAEQVVTDALASAFNSAGQRCSALRILCLQEEVADHILAMIKGALKELSIGPTDRLKADIGPVITAQAKATIEAHIAAMRRRGARIEQDSLSDDSLHGSFVAPAIIEIGAISEVQREVFGPVLHVIRYRRENLLKLINEVNATGYGLTFGLHSRLDETRALVSARIKAGNIYVNRNMIGAVVGAQPFGGRGLSGTGPKAGGPLYLGRLVKKPPDISARVDGSAPLIGEFADWLDAQGESESGARARRYGDASLLGLDLLLPGPVGEHNRYTLRPRGMILMSPVSRSGMFEQMAAIIATGNMGVLQTMPLPQGLPPRIAAAFGSLAKPPYAGVLIEGDAARIAAMTARVADFPGAIIPTFAPQSGQSLHYACNWLLDELSISMDRTAVGGNPGLMMMGDR